MTGAALRTTLRREAVIVATALLWAMLAASLLIMLYGQSPARVYGLMLVRTFGDAYGVGQVLFRATPLLFCGLSVALAFRAGLFNIGAEGQMLAGSFAAGIVGAKLTADVSPLFGLPLVLMAAAGSGAAVAAVPGVLRARFGAHEVISTMMLNFIVAALVLWLGHRGAYLPHTVHTAPIPSGGRLASLGLGGSAASVALLLALAAAAGVAWLLGRSRLGFELRVMGQGAEAARAGGVPVGRRTVQAMALAGVLAGLAASATVVGGKGYHEDGLGAGVGFMGIAVALLGRAHPAGVVAAALLLGWVAQGALAASALVPKEIVDVLQAVIILSIAVSTRREAVQA